MNAPSTLPLLVYKATHNSNNNSCWTLSVYTTTQHDKRGTAVRAHAQTHTDRERELELELENFILQGL